jgi:hypothetical protein
MLIFACLAVVAVAVASVGCGGRDMRKEGRAER